MAHRSSIAWLRESETLNTLSLLFRYNRAALLYFATVLLVIFVAVFAGLISPRDPLEINIRNNLAPPSLSHPLGTDALGRDVLSRLIWGGRFSMFISFSAVGISILLGMPLGLISGYYGGVIDIVIMRVVDIMLSFPALLLALTIVAILGVSDVTTIIAIAIANSPRLTRVIRGSVLSIRENEYIEAARGFGAGDRFIIMRHILPNVSAVIIVMSTMNIAGAILAEAALSFLGLGVQPPWPSWGSIINDGREYLRFAPWIATSSGLIIMVTVLGFTQFGDAIRDAYDPRLREVEFK